MTLESIANLLAHSSVACSLSFWLWAILNIIPGMPRFDIPGPWWLAIMGIGVLLSGAAALGRSKLWLLATPLALGMFLLMMYIVGS